MTVLQSALRRFEQALAKMRAIDPLYKKGQTALDIYRKMVTEDHQLKAEIKSRLKGVCKRVGRKPRTDSILVFSRAEKKREQAKVRMRRMRAQNKIKQLCNGLV